MGLKSMIVYGELSTLLGQIRHKVDFNPDGSLYEFVSLFFSLPFISLSFSLSYTTASPPPSSP